MATVNSKSGSEGRSSGAIAGDTVAAVTDDPVRFDMR